MIKYTICVCGHADFEHLFTIERHFGILRRDCQDCGCNRFELMGDLTVKEWNDYKEKNEIK